MVRVNFFSGLTVASLLVVTAMLHLCKGESVISRDTATRVRSNFWKTSMHAVSGGTSSLSAFHTCSRTSLKAQLRYGNNQQSQSSSSSLFIDRNTKLSVSQYTKKPFVLTRTFAEKSSSSSIIGSDSATTSAAQVDEESSTDFIANNLRRVKTVHATSALAEMSGVLVKIQGWVRTIRQQKTVAFIQVNDGSNLEGIQGVAALGDLDEASKLTLDAITTGAAVELHGFLVKSSGQNQSVELQISNIILIGSCPADTYPLAKKRHSLEYLRSIAHLRARTNTHSAVSRVRSQLALAIHEYFQKECGFVYVQTPLITASDCEGAGELFRVTTFNIDQPHTIPQQTNNITGTKGTDYKEDFFSKPAFLTVSGQLNGEAYATALGDIYTFGPTFRAENSQTTRHLAEFHMIEPEMSFCDLMGAMDNAEQMLKYVMKHILDQCNEDIQFFTKFFDKNLLSKLQRLRDEPFVRISYTDAINYLQEEIAKDPSKWQFPKVEFGTDLATEHERWLAETKFNNCVFVYNYPKSIKAFYMRDNDEADPSKMTVAAMDLLVPGVGELIGGSQREERLQRLEEKLTSVGLKTEDYSWYLDLRRFGSVPHSGYGLGFERLVTYCCGLENIRDAIAFPRYPGNAEF